MKDTYTLFWRKNRQSYYIQNRHNRSQRCLHTKDWAEAKKLQDAENQSHQSPALNLQLGKAYISHADPKMATRTWQEAIDEMSAHGKPVSQARYAREFKASAYDSIRKKPIIETTCEDLKTVLRRGGVQTNNYLRRLHNLALGNGWIQWHVIPPKQWPKTVKKPRRAITAEEHGRIIAAEGNEERRLYYEMLWLIGAAQTDCALLRVEDSINWQTGVLCYERRKTKEWAYLQIGKSMAALLSKLPKQGFLFPKIAAATIQDQDRAAKFRSAEFHRRCRILEIKDVSLHSYRYAWAERAYSSGYDERFAQAALGHKSPAIHHGYPGFAG